MKQIAVISGKGGTGKTVLTASFACLARKNVLVDCDVDASNLYILMHPHTQEEHEFSGAQVAVVVPDKCTECGTCETVCRFGAVTGSVVDPMGCEGCGVCYHMCPSNAIVMENKVDGIWFISKTKYGPFVHARLGAGRPNSGKLVSLIRKKAASLATDGSYASVLIDGPPGAGCPVIATLSGIDVALVVAEPTLSGLHDIGRVIRVANHFGVKSAVCVNKYDLNRQMTVQIETYCRENEIPMLGRVSFSHDVQDSVNKCVPFIEFTKNGAAGEGVSGEIEPVWERLKEYLNADL